MHSCIHSGPRMPLVVVFLCLVLLGCTLAPLSQWLLPCNALYAHQGGYSTFAPLESTHLVVSDSLLVNGVDILARLHSLESALASLQGESTDATELIATVQAQ